MTVVEVRPAVSGSGWDAGAWWALWRELSPRRTVRVDRDRVHVYAAAQWAELGETVPAFPYALYLADGAGRYRLLCFDLDASRGDVEQGCRVVRRLLDDAGIEYVVAASGPGGGRHIWSAWPQGLEPAAVRRLADVLQVLVPALDPGCLSNPVSGCVRPIGAVHRHGGRAELLDGQLPGRAAAVLRRGNPGDRLQALWAVLPGELRERAAGEPAAVAGGEKPTPGQAGDVDELAARRARLVVGEDGRAWKAGSGRPRLAGGRRELDDAARRLLFTPAPAGADTSAVAWRCLLRLVFARYSHSDVAQLLADPRAHGLEHLRSAAVSGGGPRVPRSAALRTAMLARQWDKAVDAVVEMHRGTGPAADAALTALVDRAQAAADGLDPRRWTEQAGPGDRLVLDVVCLLALTHGINPVGASVRMVADLAGIGSSTAHRSLARLARPDSTGRVWLAAAELAEGRTAATWQLLDVAQAVDPACPSAVDGTDAPDGPAPESDITASTAVCIGGTQGNPPPGGDGGRGADLAAELRFRLDHQRADVWTPRGGLGHHAARTHAAVLSGPRSLLELTWMTGYATRTVLAHLRLLVALRLVEVDGTTVVATDRSLVEAARELGVDGVAAVRRLRQSTDREVLAWWNAELEWRRATGKRARRDRRGRRTGRRGPPAGTVDRDQAVLPVAVGPRHTYGRFPVHADGTKRGRADFAAAHRVVHAHLARHPHASAPGITKAA